MSEPDTETSTHAPAERLADAGANSRGAGGSNRPAGTLVFAIGDHRIDLEMIGGGEWTLPIGVLDLVEGPLEGADRPRPEHLTNALGVVTDHLDDVLIEAPIVASAPAVAFTGPHAVMVARVELGDDDVPADYVLARADADEVFRTIVAEPRAERAHNPGLDADHVDTIVAACCVVLAVLRRLDLQGAGVAR
ncbi:MAG: hypothetical protein AAFP84_06995 [Actinomycetota bacterium]